ncbi:sirohydrochlorin chelatase [Williamsia sterculiae]|uniref:Sirohydrochlorin ferrochelatase n=1 Tax=Williamsia sterculiae TaxID=1344003 RepID=A0A1N7G688_9NOCA|nr:sirohydrochlorin chelatase [Williamsia sterculiae]SIS08127.1 Sirohydrochlorin ferrochelatase [Williamsia sterculiae]
MTETDRRRTTVLLVAHGSRDPRFAMTARRVTGVVAARLPDLRVRLAYLDLDAPTVGEALADCVGDMADCVGDMADCVGDTLVVPLLFGNAYHARVDLPALLDDARAANPELRVRQTAPIGSPALTAALADRLDELGVRPDDGILLCAVGSSDTAADDAVIERGRRLSRLLHRPVVTGFATRSDAIVDAANRLAAEGCGRIVVSPFFLAAGTLLERVERLLDGERTPDLDWAMAGPLGAHPAVIDTIVSRVGQVTGAAGHDSGACASRHLPSALTPGTVGVPARPPSARESR